MLTLSGCQFVTNFNFPPEDASVAPDASAVADAAQGDAAHDMNAMDDMDVADLDLADMDVADMNLADDMDVADMDLADDIRCHGHGGRDMTVAIDMAVTPDMTVAIDMAVTPDTTERCPISSAASWCAASAGSHMTVVGGGSSKRYYRCNDYGKRGTCDIRYTVREHLVRERVLDALRETFSAPEMLKDLRPRVAHYQSEQSRTAGAQAEVLRETLAKTKLNIGNLVRKIAEGDPSPSVVDWLQGLETQALNDQRALDQVEALATTAISLPTPQHIRLIVAGLDDLLTREVTAGREALREVFKGSVIRLHHDMHHGAHDGASE